MQYFFHSSIRNYTIALLDMFNDIHVPRYDSNGNKIEDFIVPIEFGNKDKAYQISKHDIENLHSGNVNAFPRMALSFESLSKAPHRDTNKLSKINKRKNPNEPLDLIREYQYNGRAYDFSYTIYLATRSFTDATIIIEQIAPMFRPDISLKIQELDIQEEATTVPVKLGDFDVLLPEVEEDEIRIIEVSFPIVLEGNLYLPIKDQGIIEKLEVNINIVEAQRAEASIKYGIDELVEEISAVSKTSAEPGGDLPTTSAEVPEAQEESIISIKHFENNLPT